MNVIQLVSVLQRRENLRVQAEVEAEVLRQATSPARRAEVLRALREAEARLVRFDNLSVEEAAVEVS